MIIPLVIAAKREPARFLIFSFIIARAQRAFNLIDFLVTVALCYTYNALYRRNNPHVGKKCTKKM